MTRGAEDAARVLLTLGPVPTDTREEIAELWAADAVDSCPGESDSVLLVHHQGASQPAEYVETLRDLDRLGCKVGVLPVTATEPDSATLKRLLGGAPLDIDLSRSRCRLPLCAEANLPGAPPVLRRAARDDEESVEDDLATTDLLVLQGHSGPVDAGFGRWLTFCSRHLHKGGESPVFACFGTDRCFRQEAFGREETSADGLVDPSVLRAALLVMDGCGTMPVPGSIFPFETSMIRSVLSSGVQAAVATHGLSATPLSVFVLFLAALAEGRTLGEAVRDANRHGQESHCLSAIAGPSAGPWVLVGDPDARVTGLPLVEVTAQPEGSGYAFALDDADVSAKAGALVAVTGAPIDEGPFDVVCSDGRWARGAFNGQRRAYLWVGPSPARGKERAGEPGASALALTRRPPHPAGVWQRRSQLVSANERWLSAMAKTADERGGDAEPVRSLVSLWSQASGAIEAVAFAAGPNRRSALAPPLAAETAGLAELVSRLDHATVRDLAAAVPTTGARLSRLWFPQWLDAGPAEVAELCSCGCPISGHVRCHAVTGLARITLSCPACGMLGEVSARPAAGALTAADVVPTVLGVPGERMVAPGDSLRWPVRRLCHDDVDGYACGALIDGFRQRQIVTDPVCFGPGAELEVPLELPEDWPAGLSQAVVVVCVGGELSLLDFDIVVRG